MLKAVIVLAVLALAVPAVAGPQIAEWVPVQGATGYELEQSVGAGFLVTQSGILPAACTATLCSVTINPPTGVARWRVVALFGTLRVPRLDAGFYTCLGLAECPLAATSAGVR